MTTDSHGSMPVRIPTDVLRDLHLLKLAWKKKSLGEVIRVLVEGHQLDKLQAIGIQIPGDQREVYP